jgi:hypothetical protein
MKKSLLIIIRLYLLVQSDTVCRVQYTEGWQGTKPTMLVCPSPFSR